MFGFRPSQRLTKGPAAGLPWRPATASYEPATARPPVPAFPFRWPEKSAFIVADDTRVALRTVVNRSDWTPNWPPSADSTSSPVTAARVLDTADRAQLIELAGDARAGIGVLRRHAPRNDVGPVAAAGGSRCGPRVGGLNRGRPPERHRPEHRSDAPAGAHPASADGGGPRRPGALPRSRRRRPVSPRCSTSSSPARGPRGASGGPVALEAFDELQDFGPGLCAFGPGAAVDHVLDGGEEALGDRVVVAVANQLRDPCRTGLLVKARETNWQVQKVGSAGVTGCMACNGRDRVFLFLEEDVSLAIFVAAIGRPQCVDGFPEVAFTLEDPVVPPVRLAERPEDLAAEEL